MMIKKKSDVTEFLTNKAYYWEYDDEGVKWYIVFTDKNRGGLWTLMGYDNENYTVHGRGEKYVDSREEPLEDVVGFVWKNRAAINKVLKTR